MVPGEGVVHIVIFFLLDIIIQNIQNLQRTDWLKQTHTKNIPKQTNQNKTKKQNNEKQNTQTKTKKNILSILRD